MDIRKAATELLCDNANSVGSYRYTRPSRGEYQQQWFWDSSFHAVALAALEPTNALKELQSLLAGQEKSGFIPHMHFWKPSIFAKLLYGSRHSRLIQAPVLGICLERVDELLKDKSFLRAVLPNVNRFYDYLLRERMKDGLIASIHPWEVLDESPVFDSTLGARSLPGIYLKSGLVLLRHKLLGWDTKKILNAGYFNVRDVLVNSVTIESLKALARLNTGKIGEMYKRQAELLTANLMQCYDDGFFYDLDKYGKKIRVKTVCGLMPLVISGLDRKIAKRLVDEHLLNPAEFWLPYPVPSVAKSEPTFMPGDSIKSLMLWRGGSWMNINWMLCRGLRKNGYADAAKMIEQKSIQMVKKSGFREFYNSLTAEGCGEHNYGWSTLAVDMHNEI